MRVFILLTLSCMCLVVCRSAFGFVDELFAEDYTKIVHKITSDVSKKLKKEMNLQCIGTGGGMMDVIRCISVSFELNHEIDLAEARRVIIDVTETYLDAINGSKRVRPYLKNYPFTLDNLEIDIFVNKSRGKNVSIGEIACVAARRSLILYELYEPKEGGPSLKEFCEEPYLEALRIVNEEKAQNISSSKDGEIEE